MTRGHPRDLNLRLVDAQETRRILDRRLRLHEVSPVLWKKVNRSCRRPVQSVATRWWWERARERIASRPPTTGPAGAVRHEQAEERPRDFTAR
ncbi:hypothetical protein GCM10020220_106420 [Nonomuraea rubra]|uniref:hypothetical protein n=1 Tax=Nonomuraea rubra TaxID=46180 RepID=UPI0033724C4C